MTECTCHITGEVAAVEHDAGCAIREEARERYTAAQNLRDSLPLTAQAAWRKAYWANGSDESLADLVRALTPP